MVHKIHSKKGGVSLKHKKLLIGIIGGIMLSGVLSSCTNKKSQAEIEEGFEKVLSMYPTKNLMDFYDMEGYRDSEFEEGDKGVWVLDSDMSISQTKESPLVTEGMLLQLNRNTRTAEGFYYQWSTSVDLKDKAKKEYPVTYDETGIHLQEEIEDEQLKNKIENFQFFVQYANFKEFKKYKNLRKMYNPEVPMYELEYQLTNDDWNVKQLRERYDIPTKEAPTLVLSGVGALGGSTLGHREMTIQFTKKPPIFFSDSIDYQPSMEEAVK
ncbi:tandem-type lipoprotein [Enterococcus faecalis]|nr:tandem-type lipoprotein [Enterococcus faecalis]EHQ8833058.1 tandem-type lipoprotein [Enterococcus faecalis]EIB3067227.1 tandem-type lipoprotein [Enterococcus faecalis]ELY1998290.1 tandem-type lipoprotein [Enterococcus faecalis]MBD9845066.1 tandem-type lipoprotein [Enterococcus faecalis]